MIWTFEKCKEEALKYTTKKDFRKNSSACYSAAQKNGWLIELTKHMIQLVKPNGYWTFERCKEEALKYNTRVEFQKKSSSAYGTAYKNKWLNSICGHMTIKHLPNGYWTFEKCKEEALKYKTKEDFKNNSLSAYSVSKKNKWFNDITKHMIPATNNSYRCIYAYEFPDKHVYVGLTESFTTRKGGRLNRIDDQVAKYVKLTSQTPKYIQLSDYMPPDIARIKEGEYLQKYINDGWIKLNIATTGGLGSCKLYWTLEKCIEVAKTCSSKYELNNNFRGAYNSCKKNGWLDIVSEYFYVKEIIIKYDFNACKEKALLCKSRQEFKKKYIHEFSSAYRNDWLDLICKHMAHKYIKKWFKENALEASLLCSGRYDFRKKFKGAYDASLKNGWLDEFFPKNKIKL